MKSSIRSFAGRLAAIAILCTSGGQLWARGVSPYLPLKLSPEIERQIERVLILGDKPMLTRPIAAATVLDALPKACKRDAQLCQQVRRYLDRYMKGAKITHASVEVAAAKNNKTTVPNARGMTEDSEWAASITGYVQPYDHLSINLGATGFQDQFEPTDSYVSMGFDFAQLDIGYRDHWLSPFSDSSMLVSTNAPNLPSVTLSNYRPLTRLGFQYEVFLANLSRSDIIGFENRFTSGHPRLGGVHLAIEPAPGWSLAFNRILQYGGGERPGSFTDLFHAFVNPSKYDNTNPSLTSDQQAGNQLASINTEFVFPGKTPFSVYAEYAAEDGFHADNFRFGNNALSAGIHFPLLWKRFEFTYEYSEWQNLWYVHGVYGDGLTNDHHVLGHWGGDWRVYGDGVGAASHMLQVAWEPRFGGEMELRYRTLANESYSPYNYQRAHELSLRYSMPLRQYTVGAQIDAGRDVFGDDFGRLGAFVRYSENAPKLYAASDEDDEDGADTGAERFVDLGISHSRRRFDISDGVTTPVTTTSTGAHFGLGARRAVSSSNDLGMRIEVDDVEGRPLFAVRAFDYRHRFGRKFALTAFAGAARYSIRSPAHGYYGGVGAQWRDLVPKWDLSLDLRYADRVVRDKVFPGEYAPPPPPANPGYPDEFSDIFSGSVYLSYRF